MSLEKALEANTAAVLALTEAISKGNLPLLLQHDTCNPLPPQTADALRSAVGTEPEVRARAAINAKKREAAAAPSKAAPAPVAEAPASTEAAPPAATSTSLSYDDIKAPFLNLAKRDLPAAQALIAEFGFKTLKDAKPEQYAEILTRLSAE